MKSPAMTIARLIVLTLALVLPAIGRAETAPSQPGIQFFQGTFNEARAKAKAEKKYLFVDAYASWCGPCKTMEREVYSDPAVAGYFNRNFIALKVDMEKGEGPALAKRLPSVDGYPSLLFFGPDGYLTKTVLGSRSPGDFLAEARLVVK